MTGSTDGLNSGYFGIDLGTTYSCIARIDRFGRPEVIDNRDGERTTPSVIFFDTATNAVVGTPAKQAMAADPTRGIALVKRRMGDLDWTWELDGAPFGAPKLSALILKALKEGVEAKTGELVKGVVITVPAYFGDTERKATRAAGEIAGLDVVGLINEPTAAAFFLGMNEIFATDEASAKETLLVFDLGGGTFDVTVMTVEKGLLEVKATGGHRRLGGADWDEDLVDLVIDKLRAQDPGAPDPATDPIVRSRLLAEAEELKRALTEREKVARTVTIAGNPLRIEVTRQEFEDVTAHRLDLAIKKTHEVIEEARDKGVTNFDELLLVGGASKMPAVTKRLQEEFGLTPKLRDPDLAVAMGAAMIAAKEGILRELEIREPSSAGEDPTAEGRQAQSAERDRQVEEQLTELGLPPEQARILSETQLKNVCSQGFGVVVLESKTKEKFVDFLVERNASLPTETSTTYFTTHDDQESIEIRVMEQDSDPASKEPDRNKDVVGGTGVLRNIPRGYPEGTPLQVHFEMSDDGCITVTAKHPGVAQALKVEGETTSIKSLSPEEIDNAKQAIQKVHVT